MDPERWRQIDDILDAALALREQDRPAFLKVSCRDDDALRDVVESLLAHAAAASRLPETPAAEAATPPIPSSADLTDEAPTQTLPVARQHHPPEQAIDLVSGQVFGPFRIQRLLGQGGMGKVYLAEERDTGRRVALKILNRANLTQTDRKRFLREGRLAASLSHEHVIYVFGTTEVEGTPTIVMELAPGGTLKDRVQIGGPFEPAHAVDAILQLIAGLGAAAAIGILHRDIKPSNCFVDSRGGVKIGDFGLSISTLARTDLTLTESGTCMATPAFAAPEQLRGETLDLRSDIYAVGATLYYLLTGRAPIEETNLMRLVARVGQETPPSPRAFQPIVPTGLAAIVLRCLAKDPANRFETYADLSTALAAFSSLASPPARIGPRLVAGLIDCFLIIVVTSAVSPFLLQPFVVQWAIFPVARPWAPFQPAIANLVAVLQALVYLAYFGVLEGIGSRSLGKRVCGIRVAASDGGTASAGIVLARSFLFTVCGLVATLIEPRAARRGEMQVHARVTSEPPAHGWTFVRARVVHDEMQIEAVGRFAIQPLEKRDELLCAVPRVTLADDHPIEHAQGRKERGRAVSNIVVRLPLGHVGLQRQHRARAVEGLDIALFIDREHDGSRWRIQIQPHDVAEFFDEARVFRVLKPLESMRLQPMLMPNAADHRGGGGKGRGERGGGREEKRREEDIRHSESAISTILHQLVRDVGRRHNFPDGRSKRRRIDIHV